MKLLKTPCIKLSGPVPASVVGAFKYAAPSWVTTPSCVLGARAPASETCYSSGEYGG